MTPSRTIVLQLASAMLFASVSVAGDDKVVVDEEEEVSFDDEEGRDQIDGMLVGEEVRRSDLNDEFFMPEHADSRWMLALPILCVLMLAWNVRWGAYATDANTNSWPDGADARRQPQTGAGGKKSRTPSG